MFARFFPVRLPTSELYGLTGRYPRLSTSRRCMGEAFRVGMETVTVRCAPLPEGSDRFSVLIDDDMEALIADDTVPQGYRDRLGRAWREAALARHPEKVNRILVPSKRLEEVYLAKGHSVILMDPYWPVPKEFRIATSADKTVRVAFLGSRSHLGDLEILKPALEDAGRKWTFHHFLGRNGPDWLQQLPGISASDPSSWGSYKKMLSSRRYDICVYPLRATSVNSARSCNKIMEHAMTGAVSLFSECVPFRAKLGDLGGSLLVPDGGWADAIDHLAHDRNASRELAFECHRLGLEIATFARSRQEEVWSSIEAGSL